MHQVVNMGVEAGRLLEMMTAQTAAYQEAMRRQDEAMRRQEETNALLKQQLEAMRVAAGANQDKGGRSLPSLEGEPFTGDSKKLDAWIRNARVQVDRLAEKDQKGQRAVSFLTQGLKDQALVWYQEVVTKPDAAEAAPKTPEELFARLTAYFRPQLAAEHARSQLRYLQQGKLTVGEYTARFRELLAYIPRTTLDGEALVQFFRDGLNHSLISIIVTQAEQPKTLMEMESLALRLEASRKSIAPAALAALDVEAGEQIEQLALAVFNKLAPRLPGGGAGARHGNREGQTPRMPYNAKVRDHIKGLSDEERARRRSEGLCFHCGKSGHIARECASGGVSPGGPTKWQGN